MAELHKTSGGKPRSAASTGYNAGGSGSLGQGGDGAYLEHQGMQAVAVESYYGGAGGTTNYPN